MQRYWMLLEADHQSAFSEDEWDTFLLEPQGLYAAVLAQAGPAAVLAEGVVGKGGVAGAVAAPATVLAVGDIYVRVKTGGVAAQASPAATLISADLGYGGTVSGQSGPASTTIVGQRGITGAVSAEAGEARAGTMGDDRSGTVQAEAAPAQTVVIGVAATAITGTVDALAGNAAVAAGGGLVIVAAPIMVGASFVADSRHDALRNPVDVTWMSNRVSATGQRYPQAHKWSVKRERGEVELFYDDREIDLFVGGYER